MACDSSALKTSACSNGFAQAASDEVLFRALMLQLLCIISTDGAGGGITTGVGDPTSTPTSDGAIYFDTATGAQWSWWSGSWH